MPWPAAALGDRVEANCSAATGGNISGSTVSIVCGIAPEQLEALVRDRSRPLQDLADTQKELIGHLQEQLDLNQAQIRAVLNATGEADIAPDAIAAKLVEIAGRYRQLLTQVDGVAASDPAAARLKAEARESLDRGDLDHADQLLARLSVLQDEAQFRQAMEAAATPARRAAVALTRLRYLEAAGHFAAAAERVPPGHQDERLDYLAQAADALYQQGEEKGDNQALAMAVERYRELQRLRPREQAPLVWAGIQTNLGKALLQLGQRAGDAGRLEEAAEAFRQALQVRSREAEPLAWAATQNSLAKTLEVLGEHEVGTARLEQAAEAYRQVLQVRTRAAHSAGLGRHPDQPRQGAPHHR